MPTLNVACVRVNKDVDIYLVWREYRVYNSVHGLLLSTPHRCQKQGSFYYKNWGFKTESSSNDKYIERKPHPKKYIIGKYSPIARKLKFGNPLKMYSDLWETGKPWEIRPCVTRSRWDRVNHSQPEISQDHWLCLGNRPLNYIWVGPNQPISPLNDKTHWEWGQSKATLEDYKRLKLVIS